MRTKNFIWILFILLLVLGTTGFSPKKVYCRLILTTDLTNDTPVNDLTGIPINTDKILVYTYWYNLTVDKEYDYKIAIFDGEKNILLFAPTKFTPSDSSWHTLTTYKVNPQLDKPGKWKFQVYLDNKLKAKRELDVDEDKKN